MLENVIIIQELSKACIKWNKIYFINETIRKITTAAILFPPETRAPSSSYFVCNGQ